MQFNEGTAPGYPLKKYWDCIRSACYVCSEKGCKVKDDREDPYIAVPAAAQLLKDYGKQFESYTDQELFTLAAYNAGPETIKTAIGKTGKSNPSWEEVRKKLDAGVACYPCKVEYYKKAFAQEFNIPIDKYPVPGQTKTSCGVYNEQECYSNLDSKCYPDLTAKGFFSACKYCEDNFKCGQVLVEKLCNMNPCSKTCEWKSGACFAK